MVTDNLKLQLSNTTQLEQSNIPRSAAACDRAYCGTSRERKEDPNALQQAWDWKAHDEVEPVPGKAASPAARLGCRRPAASLGAASRRGPGAGSGVGGFSPHRRQPPPAPTAARSSCRQPGSRVRAVIPERGCQHRGKGAAGGGAAADEG